LLSTLEEIFLGNKELFKDLYIYDKWDWKEYRVIHLDFSFIDYHTTNENFRNSLIYFCSSIAKEFNIEINTSSIGIAFKELISKLAGETKIVILIDEYDKPIIDYLTDKPKAIENREILREFYTILKGSDEFLKFVILTGVSKFSKVSIFSGLNNLEDITLGGKYSTMLGITQEELEKYFPEGIERLAKKYSLSKPEMLNVLKTWYNGYSWDGINKVYNPFSLLNLFSKYEMRNYWFATGTPTFLVDLIKSEKIFVEDFEEKEISESSFDSYDIDNMNVFSLMFQTGYLTIKEVIIKNQRMSYKLTYPNQEVKEALITNLISRITDNRIDEVEPRAFRMRDALEEGRIEDFTKILKAQLASIPYQLHIEEERYYHSLFYMIFSLIGIEMDSEVITNQGRIDGVIKFDKTIYVIEFKYGKEGTNIQTLIDNAFAQIRERKYYERYLSERKEILLLAVAVVKKEARVEMCKL